MLSTFKIESPGEFRVMLNKYNYDYIVCVITNNYLTYPINYNGSKVLKIEKRLKEMSVSFISSDYELNCDLINCEFAFVQVLSKKLTKTHFKVVVTELQDLLKSNDIHSEIVLSFDDLNLYHCDKSISLQSLSGNNNES